MKIHTLIHHDTPCAMSHVRTYDYCFQFSRDYGDDSESSFQKVLELSRQEEEQEESELLSL